MKKKKKKLSAAVVILIVAAVIMAGVVAAAAAYMYTIVTSDEIYPNVYIAGINVGGMTKEEALAALDSKIDTLYGADDIVVQLPDREKVFTPEIVGASLSSDEAVTGAWEFGRAGTPFQQVGAYLDAMRKKVAYTVNAGLSIDETSIRNYIAEIAAETHVDMKETTVLVKREENKIMVLTGVTGLDIDQSALYNAIASSILNHNFEPISIDYLVTPYPVQNLDSIYNDVYVAVKDAYYDNVSHEIVAEQVGYGFDLTAANQQIAMAADEQQLIVTMSYEQPEVTKADLEAIYFTDVLASFQTGSLGGANRVNNITLACAALNGKVLSPGEVFSYNGTVGQRTAEKGYKAAGAYVGGKSVSELGGGICQVSSTLYYCTLLANLEIVSRTCHMFTVGYVPLGMDATVSWPNPDFQFRNNTEYPIRIEAKVESGLCKISLIGTKTDNITVEMHYGILSTIPFTTIITEDPSKVNDVGRTGYNVVSYRKLINADTGEVISDEVEAYSYYQKTDIYVLKEEIDQEVDDQLQQEQEEQERQEQEEQEQQQQQQNPPPSTPTPTPTPEPTPPPEPTPDPVPES